MPVIQIADKPTLDNVASNVSGISSSIGSVASNVSGISSSIGSVASDVTYIKDHLPSCGSGSMPMDVRDISYTEYDATNSIFMRWLDPLDSVDNPQWAGTKIVRKEGSVPSSPTDGTVVLNSTTRDAYFANEFSDTYASEMVTYYRFFPYDVNGNHYAGSVIEFSAGKIKLCSFANGTNSEVRALISAAQSGKLDLYADAGWRVGDTRFEELSSALWISYGTSSSVVIANPQRIQLTLVDAGETSETDGLFSSTHTTNVPTSSWRTLHPDDKNKDGTNRNHPLFTVAVDIPSLDHTFSLATASGLGDISIYSSSANASNFHNQVNKIGLKLLNAIDYPYRSAYRSAPTTPTSGVAYGSIKSYAAWYPFAEELNTYNNYVITNVNLDDYPMQYYTVAANKYIGANYPLMNPSRDTGGGGYVSYHYGVGTTSLTYSKYSSKHWNGLKMHFYI